MRRTRHVALPVKAWQYIGLLIVSLACLTLGLVSRDKEGRAGSLAGPELEHQAPHEVDACPNSLFFAKMPYSILDDDQTRVRKTSVEPGSRRTSSLPDTPRISRSRSLDRSSEARQRSKRDSRIERRLADREATDHSRFRTRSQESQRRSSDPIRLSRSSDLDARLATRFLDRRSRIGERGSVVDRREGRDTAASRIAERRERSADRFDVRDSRSRSTERQESILNRETSRIDRREVRERRARSLDRREPNFERVNRNRDREDRQRSLVNRMDRRAEDRRSLARDLRQVRTAADEDRRNIRSVLAEKRNSVAARILDSRSRAFERASSYSRINGQYSRSLDRRKSMNELSERKLAIRSANMEERRETNTINSRERSMDLGTSDSRRGRIDPSESLRTIGGRNRMRLATGRTSKSDVDRRFAVRSERREENNERRERLARSDRRFESGSNEIREPLARSLERSKVDNLERRERTNRVSRDRVARSSEIVKRDLDRRARSLSVDRRSERRTLLDSRRSAERQSRNDGNRKEIRTERSRINDFERRERSNRVTVDRQARESRDRVARTSERDLDRRTRDLSSDRRSERRASVESRSLERSEIRNDRSRINRLERREEPRRVTLPGRARTDLSRTPEAAKRVLERRVRDLSAERRLDHRTAEVSRTLERQERREIMNDRSRINRLERREEPRRVTLPGRARTDLSRTPEAAKRVLERRVRDLSAERRLDHRTAEVSRTLERQERREIMNDRSRINNLERREEPRQVTLLGRARTDLSRTPEAAKRVLERRVRDLSVERRSERRTTAETRTLKNRERQEIRNDRTRINDLERREEARRSALTRRSMTDLSRTSEASNRLLERRARDLSADRRSERRSTVDARTSERRERQEIRNNRSRTNSVQRVRDLSAERRLERGATVASRSLERRERREIRSDPSRINNFERREESRRLTLVRETRADLSRTSEASKRDLEARDSNQRSERRVTVRSRSSERRHAENDKRAVVRTLLNRAIISRSNSANRRSLERSTLTLDRSNRLNLARESRTLFTRTPEASNRDSERRAKDLSDERRSDRRALDAGRPIGSSMAVNRREKLDRSLESGRLLRQKMDVARLQRSNDHTNDIQRRQRLIATRRLSNNVRRSRLVEPSVSHGSRKDSTDSLRQIQSSRYNRISDFDEASSRLKISEVLEQGDSMKNNTTLEIIRQAIVIGLCAVYGLSILRGKQSFISNLARQPARLILW